MGAIQSSINQSLAIAGAIASQSPEFNATRQARIENRNFQNLQKSVDELTTQYAKSEDPSEKRELTRIANALKEEQSESLERSKEIAVKRGDIEGIKSYYANKKDIKTTIKKASQALRDEQIKIAAQKNAIKQTYEDIVKEVPNG